mmetsp:Transcript_174/g.310  ORF Transcript_174/g.310 Transcript_174/m.310 type:complete len:102 (+) Transcript_174:146-451(+)
MLFAKISAGSPEGSNNVGYDSVERTLHQGRTSCTFRYRVGSTVTTFRMVMFRQGERVCQMEIDSCCQGKRPADEFFVTVHCRAQLGQNELRIVVSLDPEEL